MEKSAGIGRLAFIAGVALAPHDHIASMVADLTERIALLALQCARASFALGVFRDKSGFCVSQRIIISCDQSQGSMVFEKWRGSVYGPAQSLFFAFTQETSAMK